MSTDRNVKLIRVSKKNTVKLVFTSSLVLVLAMEIVLSVLYLVLDAVGVISKINVALFDLFEFNLTFLNVLLGSLLFFVCASLVVTGISFIWVLVFNFASSLTRGVNIAFSDYQE